MTTQADRWVEIQIEVDAAASELLANAVSELTGGVEVRDSRTLIRAAENREIIVTLAAPEKVDEVLRLVHDLCGDARAAGLPVDPVEVRRRDAHESEWRDVWKQFFRATRVGRTFIVRPSWDPSGVSDGDRVIDLDPGRAFGTGGHATTRLVIALAETLEGKQPVRRFLDLGCGSGILAIAAARLWPDAVGLAVDNDPEATACAQENFERNRVETVTTQTGVLDAQLGGAFDLVLANIQADVLIPLAGALPAHLAPGAAVVLSGILVGQAESVLEAYRQHGMELVERRDEDEWAALLLRWAAGASVG